VVYLVTNITDSSPSPYVVNIGDIPNRAIVEIHPGESIDLELLSTRNQICQSTHIKSLSLQGKITIDTLGTEPGDCGRLYVDAKISGGDIVIDNVIIDEPVMISVDIGGTESAATGTNIDGKVAINVDQIAPSKPTIVNIPVLSANTELQYIFPQNSRKFIMKVREGDSCLKVSYESGGDYITINSGAGIGEENVDISNMSLYFQVTKAPRTVEIYSWSI
jgi:hypothetical protein